MKTPGNEHRPYTLEYLESVVNEDIPALPKTQKALIKRAIEERLATDPAGFGKPLRFSLKGHRRLRVGDWRVIYRIEGTHVIITAIAHRKDVYEQ